MAEDNITGVISWAKGAILGATWAILWAIGPSKPISEIYGKCVWFPSKGQQRRGSYLLSNRSTFEIRDFEVSAPSLGT